MSSNLFYWSNTLHVSDGLSVHHQELKSVHTTTGVCQTDTADCLLTSRQQYLFDIRLLLCVQSWTPDDGRKDRPKHVECYSSKINLRTLVLLVDFTIEMFYDARPYDRQRKAVFEYITMVSLRNGYNVFFCYVHLFFSSLWCRLQHTCQQSPPPPISCNMAVPAVHTIFYGVFKIWSCKHACKTAQLPSSSTYRHITSMCYLR